MQVHKILNTYTTSFVFRFEYILFSETDKMSNVKISELCEIKFLHTIQQFFQSCNTSCTYIFSEQQKIAADYTNK